MSPSNLQEAVWDPAANSSRHRRKGEVEEEVCGLQCQSPRGDPAPLPCLYLLTGTVFPRHQGAPASFPGPG